MSQLHFRILCYILKQAVYRQCILLLEKREPDPKYRSEYMTNQLNNRRRSLYDDTVKWLNVFIQFFPLACRATKPVQSECPEKAMLPIPSHLTSNQRIHFGMDGLVSIEKSLREGQAHDILAEVRELIIGQSYNTRIVQTEFHGQTMCTRVNEYITHFKLDKEDTRHRYNHVRQRLITLGMSPTDMNLQELERSHLDAKNAVQNRGLGEMVQADSWLWGAIKPSGMSESQEDEWVTESQ